MNPWGFDYYGLVSGVINLFHLEIKDAYQCNQKKEEKVVK